MAKGQQKRNREKKKPRQHKKKALPSTSPFAASGPPGNPSQKGVSKKRR